jgi:hypothetical protein
MVSNALKFRINEMSLILKDGQELDISSIFEEVNLFDNLFVPCMTANIVVRDGLNIAELIKLGNIREFGSSRIRIYMDKEEDNDVVYEYKKEFAIYKITDGANTNSTSKFYTLHLVNEDFILSLQKKIYQNYKGTYSKIVETILKDQLKVPFVSETRNFFKSKIAEIVETAKEQEINIPNLTPFDAINFIVKRAVSNQDKADFVFYESKNGYSFIPISNIARSFPTFKINFIPKNVSKNPIVGFLGAREMKVLSSFDTLETIRDGSYSGKFIGFDTVTRTQRILRVRNIPADAESSELTNKEKNLPNFVNKENKSPFDMGDSRIVSYPFEFTRKDLDYIKKNNPKMTSFLQNTEQYVFQRKAIFTNLMQKRIQLVMPGNFGLYCGSVVDLHVPKFALTDSSKSYDESIDKTLSGKYIIIGTRHIIQNNKHETIIEIAADSNLI